jgi:hypothetical protein
MKKFLLACLTFSGMHAAEAALSSLMFKQHNSSNKHLKKPAAALFSEDKNDVYQGLGMNLSLRHLDPKQVGRIGSVRSIQIFPVNMVTTGFTYNFS